eukprot:CAMPEP_0185741216 /NCGR_PEP_ID=MMETSP1171-20130828/38840_1 /TAXON_ID=374046 /ORGANISM="Helicotheca tamensis, Strain CCMP826" /LENGTH=535 /DNA_ID=CAMNT_0028413171 /DNA_START=72 /DNA_END=1679 /DNA_ORIENTATION=+
MTMALILVFLTITTTALAFTTTSTTHNTVRKVSHGHFYSTALGKLSRPSAIEIVPIRKTSSLQSILTTTKRTTTGMNSSSSDYSVTSNNSMQSNNILQNKLQKSTKLSKPKTKLLLQKLLSSLSQLSQKYTLPSIQNLFSKLRHSTTTKVKSLVASLLILSSILFPSTAEAAAVRSGGRMGGGSFGGSSRSSYSRPSYSRSYSRPSCTPRRSYHYNYNRGSSPGCPNIVIGADPFYRPYWWNPRSFQRLPTQTAAAAATTVVTTADGTAVAVTPPPPKRTLFSHLMDYSHKFLIFVLMSKSGYVRRHRRDYNDLGMDTSTTTTTTTTTAFSNAGVLGEGVSVVQMTVALNVPNRDDEENSILYKLKELSKTARTDSRVGVQDLTSQVALELLRRKQYIVASSSKYFHFYNENKAEREYNNLAIQERGKFEKETVSKYDGVDYTNQQQKLIEDGALQTQATMAVVTILLTIEGDSTKVPTKLNSISDVEEGLRLIASDVKVGSCLRGAEILWTPEERTETLSRRDVFADYPELRIV